MKLKEIITNVFTSKAKKAEAKRKVAEEAEAKRKAKEAEAKRKEEEAEAKRKEEEAEAKRKAFFDKPYETLMSMVMKSLETTGNMTSEEISSLLQLDKLDYGGDLVTLGFIDGNFVFKTKEYTTTFKNKEWATSSFHVIKDNHLLTISNEYKAPQTQAIYKGGYYQPNKLVGYKEVSPSKNLLSFKLDGKKVYEGVAYNNDRDDYASVSKHFDFDSNLKSLFDKITFPGKDIKSKMTNPKDISRQEEIEQQLSQSLTKYKNKQEEKALEEKKQKEIEIIAREKAAQEKEAAEKREKERQRAKAQKDRLEQNPALNVFLTSKVRQ